MPPLKTAKLAARRCTCGTWYAAFRIQTRSLPALVVLPARIQPPGECPFWPGGIYEGPVIAHTKGERAYHLTLLRKRIRECQGHHPKEGVL